MTITRRNLVAAALLGGLAGCSSGTPRPQPAGTTTAARTSRPPSSGAGPAAGMPPRQAPKGPAGTRLTADTSVPLGMLDHLVTVPVTVNGKGPYHFVIDSGSSGVLHVSTALGRGLPKIGEVQQGDPSGRNSQSVSLVRVGELSIGHADFTGVEATVGTELGKTDPDGIIGVGLFEKLVVTLDHPRKVLRLARGWKPAAGHVVPFTGDPGMPGITVDAAGTSLTAVIDTGGPAVLTVPGSSGLAFRREPTPTRSARTATQSVKVLSAPLAGDLTVAGWTVHAPAVNIVDAFPVASIGAAFLHDYAVTFDMPGRRLGLSR